ncbi:hypothetical protein AB0C69_28525 [Actinomadura sp. NPDC048032]|uniref:hypothetical protein n=1 Tax=Actinomadura sp. NPDC048032 TaxID=3155747 RepID=UPI0033CF0A4D
MKSELIRSVLRFLRGTPWLLLLLALPASVAVWSGWVGLGTMTGFGEVHPLPGIADDFTVNSAITLPIGVEAYGAYALGAWLSHKRLSTSTRVFACVSAIGALLLGAGGQVAYHLLEVKHQCAVAQAARETGRTVEQVSKTMPATAPWWIVTIVACFPVMVLGMGATLAHLLRRDTREAPGEVASNIAEDAPEVDQDVAEEPEADADDVVPWGDGELSGPLATWYENAEPAPASNTHEQTSNGDGNVSGNTENAFPWKSIKLPERWPLPHPDSVLAPAAATVSSNGSNGVPEAFPAQVNGHEAAPAADGASAAETLDPETVKNAREAFATELANGESISVRQIIARCNCGYPKAKRIKAVIDPE